MDRWTPAIVVTLSLAVSAAWAEEGDTDKDKSVIDSLEKFLEGQKDSKTAKAEKKEKDKKKKKADAEATERANANDAPERPEKADAPEKPEQKAPKSKKSWLETLEGAVEGKDGEAPTLGNTIFSNDELRQAFKEGLTQGVKKAIKELGREDGYFKNLDVKIPIPEELAPAEKALSLLGQEKYVEDFVLRMNRAAETAVPDVIDIFADAILNMTFEDAMKLYNGPKDAATQYFKRTSSEKLNEKIKPIVKKMTDKAGVTSSYKKFSKKANAIAEVVGKEMPDLDAYVTGKAIDGLFFMIGKEESEIRANPAARTTDLLKKVFGK